MAWLQPSRRDLQWVKYFKLIILKMPNVRFGLVFLKPVTYMSNRYKITIAFYRTRFLILLILNPASFLPWNCRVLLFYQTEIEWGWGKIWGWQVLIKWDTCELCDVIGFHVTIIDTSFDQKMLWHVKFLWSPMFTQWDINSHHLTIKFVVNESFTMGYK